jgi:hypothetical protein
MGLISRHGDFGKRGGPTFCELDLAIAVRRTSRLPAIIGGPAKGEWVQLSGWPSQPTETVIAGPWATD